MFLLFDTSKFQCNLEKNTIIKNYNTYICFAFILHQYISYSILHLYSLLDININFICYMQKI